MHKIAVIIVTYNGMQWLEKCLHNVFRSAIPISVYIIDNGSTDGTIQFIEDNYPQVNLVKTNQNLGFGKANNIGISKALEEGADYFFLLNQDGYVYPNTISSLIEVAELNPDYGILSPIQLNGNGTNMDLNFSILMNNENCFGFVNDAYFSKLKAHYDVKFVMAAFWLITKQTIQKVGIFNPVFPHYGEDNDYVNRVRYHGGKIAIVPASLGLHDREFRETTRSKQIYGWYIDLLIRISDINKNFVIEFGRALLFFIRQFCKALLMFRKQDLILNSKNFNSMIMKNFIKILEERKKNIHPQNKFYS
ncbi:glycosyltransferase family 2 protein [Sphingobacterium hungaricum]